MNRPANYQVATLRDHVGHDFGCSTSRLLDQPRIDEFAECTGDDQWIHVDVERARTQMPGGRTIAHGLLLLGLLPAAQYELGVYPDDAANMLNYGFDKVRFLAPVPAGTAVDSAITSRLNRLSSMPGRPWVTPSHIAGTPPATCATAPCRRASSRITAGNVSKG